MLIQRICVVLTCLVCIFATRAETCFILLLFVMYFFCVCLVRINHCNCLSFVNTCNVGVNWYYGPVCHWKVCSMHSIQMQHLILCTLTYLIMWTAGIITSWLYETQMQMSQQTQSVLRRKYWLGDSRCALSGGFRECAQVLHLCQA